MYNSCNSIVQTCFMNSLYNSNSVIGSKIAYFKAKYHINFTTSTHSRIMSSIRVTVPTEVQKVSITRYKMQDTRYFISGTKPIVKTY